MYLILMVYVLIFIMSLCNLLLDGLGKTLIVENLIRVILNMFAIILFIRGLSNPEVYKRRAEPRIGCFFMQIDAILISSCMILEFYDIWIIIPLSYACLSVYTWFAIICYKW